MCGSAVLTPAAAYARARAGPRCFCARMFVCACCPACVPRSPPMCPMYKDQYMATSMNAAPVLRMRGCVCRCLSLACQRARVRGADGTALRLVCASAVSSPHSHGLTHTDGSVFIYSTCTHLALYADRLCMRARYVCVRGRARIRADACKHFPPPPSVAVSARRRSTRRRPSTRTSARGTPRESRCCSSYAPLPAQRAPRRTALGRSPTHARPVCAAAPPMRARARACVRACACSYMYKAVCGCIADGYTPVLECHRAPSASKLIDVERTHA
jgi:hypothetical protein